MTLSLGSPPVAVNDHPTLWSPDFSSRGETTAGDRLTDLEPNDALGSLIFSLVIQDALT